MSVQLLFGDFTTSGRIGQFALPGRKIVAKIGLAATAISFLCCIRDAEAQLPIQNGNFSGSAGGQLNYNSGAAPWSGTASPFDQTKYTLNLLDKASSDYLSPLEDPRISVSKLDLKAPGKARHEYDKGMQLLARKDYTGAAESMTHAVTMYPEFVAAHNALGSSYLSMGKNEEARNEFTRAVALDDHLPISHMNLGCAEFALKNYSAAEKALQKASAIAPLDQQVLTALAYAQLMNQDYAGTVATAKQVHNRVHKGAAMVHFYAAAAWDGQQKASEAQQELLTFLKEDPKSPAADDAKGLLEQLKLGPIAEKPLESLAFSTSTETVQLEKTTTEIPWTVRAHMQDLKQQQEITEAQAACEGCEGPLAPEGAAAAEERAAGNAPSEIGGNEDTGYTLHADVDEVSVFFAATDHGKAVSDLKPTDVVLRDANRPPVSILGFRSESELPLRLGLVIDTSQSITGRFGFEQAAAVDFVKKVVTGKDDMAFLVGFANSVLLIQDFTTDNKQIADGINKLAPAGGTALWDAVSFAADKLYDRKETRPVARVLVVISDGEDNSSSESLKQAIERAEREEVTVYAVSTRDNRDLVSPTFQGMGDEARLGDRALKLLSERTGGEALFPGSVSYLDKGMNDLQEIIRSRYLISYKPALFKRDGEYRPIAINAQRSGRKLHVYARKGYYAQSLTTVDADAQQD
jgi:Ca-activated chloride channel homolog